MTTTTTGGKRAAEFSIPTAAAAAIVPGAFLSPDTLIGAIKILVCIYGAHRRADNAPEEKEISRSYRRCCLYYAGIRIVRL